MPNLDEHKAALEAAKKFADEFKEASEIQAYIGEGAGLMAVIGELVHAEEIAVWCKAVQAQNPPTTPTEPPKPTEPPPTQPPPSGEKVKGIWINTDEVKKLGAVPSNVKSSAGGSTKANLSDNNSVSDAAAYANALIFAATGDTGAKDKAISGVSSMSDSGLARVLEMSRNVPMYVWAADLCGFHGEDAFLKSLVTKPLQGHSGGDNMLETAELSASNWGAMATAACIAIGLHTGDSALVDRMAEVMKNWCGAGPGKFNFTDTTWHADPKNKRGVNAKGATRDGNDINGILPEDQRRAGTSYTWPIPKTGYAWEGLTPRFVSMHMLVRAGKIDKNVGDAALARAIDHRYKVAKDPASGDDTTIVYQANKMYGLSLPTTGDSISKNVAFCAWTAK